MSPAFLLSAQAGLSFDLLSHARDSIITYDEEDRADEEDEDEDESVKSFRLGRLQHNEHKETATNYINHR